MTNRFVRLLPAALCALAVAPVCAARQVVKPPFDAFYSLVDVGHPTDLPGPLGGLTLSAADPDVLLLGGLANNAGGGVYAINVVRTCGKITGFAGSAVRRSNAPNIDGGLVIHPGGTTLFTRYSMNALGQTRPGSALMDKSVDLTAAGVYSSVGACQMVPPGFPGAGLFKVVSFSGSQWNTLPLIPDGLGTFDVGVASAPIILSGGPEGVVFIRHGSPLFPADSVLITEYVVGTVAAYEIDANGDPIVATRRPFISELSGAEGAHIDRVTGDFMFSTFTGGDRVVIVRGFNSPCPGDANDDSHVDFTDLNIVLSNYGMSAPGIPGDVDHDCSVTFSDLNLVLGQYGIVCAGG